MEQLNPIRCAIYTRKSTDEGLEKEFNTLEAQREAGENYIKSMKHQGWVAIPNRYDDGGFSGGSLKRPALKQLIADVEAGKALIKYIKKNKDFLVNKHFENYYTIPTIYMGSISPQKTPEFTSFFERRKKAGAEEAAKKCSDRITLIIKQWDRVWTLLKKESLDIVPARTVITHSVNPTISKIPSLDKIKKLLKIATYFIKNIFYIIDNSSYDYKLEQIQLHEISNRFWSRI